MVREAHEEGRINSFLVKMRGRGRGNKMTGREIHDQVKSGESR